MCKTGKNNNSDNKLDLVIRDASIVVLVCWSTFISRCAAKPRVVSPIPWRYGGSIRLLLLIRATQLSTAEPAGQTKSIEPRVDGAAATPLITAAPRLSLNLNTKAPISDQEVGANTAESDTARS